MDPEVLATMLPVFEKHCGNPSSSTHTFGWYAAELVEIAREQVAEAIGASAEEIVFTSGATESNNLALRGIAKGLLCGKSKSQVQPYILSAKTEHKAVLDPLKELQESDYKVELLEVDHCGEIKYSDCQKKT